MKIFVIATEVYGGKKKFVTINKSIPGRFYPVYENNPMDASPFETEKEARDTIPKITNYLNREFIVESYSVETKKLSRTQSDELI